MNKPIHLINYLIKKFQKMAGFSCRLSNIYNFG